VQYIFCIGIGQNSPGTADREAAATARRGEKGQIMVKDVEDLQKMSKDSMDVALKSWGVMSKGWQAIAVEMADYSKKSFEGSTAAVEKLLGAKSLDKAIEVQTAYLKDAYEDFVAEATKLGELYAELASESYKPFEGAFSKASVS
jgi:hypothetical protein